MYFRRGRIFRFFAAFLVVCTNVFCSAGWGPALASSRALVIGNGNYSGGLVQLPSPRTDAQDINQAFATAGYVSAPYFDLTTPELRGAVDQFVNSIQAGDVVVFYFSGHGTSLNGRN